jgi:hypothetical protein
LTLQHVVPPQHRPFTQHEAPQQDCPEGQPHAVPQQAAVQHTPPQQLNPAGQQAPLQHVAVVQQAFEAQGSPGLACEHVTTR